MRHTTTVIVGAGHSGLAMSRCLAGRSVDHVVLERGEVAHSWRTRRASLRLLTPNWMTRLPGFAYRATTRTGTSARPRWPPGRRTTPRVGGAGGDRYHGDRSRAGERRLRGADRPGRLARAHRRRRHRGDRGRGRAGRLPPGACRDPRDDRRGLPQPRPASAGGVLVVGASASGVQIAEELQRSGRPVTLAVGEHVRVPRTYRGRDILWWMDASGVLDER